MVDHHEDCLDWGECSGLCYHKTIILSESEKKYCGDVIAAGKCPAGCLE